MSLWGRSQNAQRWTIFRYNNLSHSTLVVNDQHQRITGSAPIIRYSDDKAFPHVVFDMSELYEGQLAKALRGAALRPDGNIIIQDEFTATDKAATVRWAMVTPAEVTIINDNTATLRQKSKQMQFKVLTDENIKLKTYSTEPKADYDAPNPNTRLIGFEVTLKPNQTVKTVVAITRPDKTIYRKIRTKPLLEWSKPIE